MADKKTIELLVSGGQANAGPPLGPALGPLGVNVMAIVNKINELTKDYSGMKVPVKVLVDPDPKQFVSELKIEKGSATPNTAKVGNLTIDQVIRIAKMKRPELLSKTLKGATKEILGVCVSIGVTAEGKDPREVQKDIDQGKYDDVLSKS
jgi:large subunit ribosomal protein L11